MTDNVARNLNENMDAMAWAKEFMRIWSGYVIGHDKTVDEGLMLAWFANSIMCGYDHGVRKEEAKINKLKSLLLLTDPVVSHVEMNKLSVTQYAEYERWESQYQYSPTPSANQGSKKDGI